MGRPRRQAVHAAAAMGSNQHRHAAVLARTSGCPSDCSSVTTEGAINAFSGASPTVFRMEMGLEQPSVPAAAAQGRDSSRWVPVPACRTRGAACLPPYPPTPAQPCTPYTPPPSAAPTVGIVDHGAAGGVGERGAHERGIDQVCKRALPRQLGQRALKVAACGMWACVAAAAAALRRLAGRTGPACAAAWHACCATAAGLGARSAHLRCPRHPPP